MIIGDLLYWCISYPHMHSALVWGSSVKFQPQRVGREHILHDEDVVQIVKKCVAQFTVLYVVQYNAVCFAPHSCVCYRA